MMMDRPTFVGIGQAPSGSFFSTYTDICNLLERLDDLPTNLGVGRGNFYTRAEAELVIKLKSKIDDFQRSRHRHATGTAGVQKKADETRAVAALAASMEDELAFARFSKIIYDYAGSANLLIRNSMLGWQNNFAHGERMELTRTQGVNAEWKTTGLVLNPGILNQPALFGVSIMVHEYHHSLTVRPDIYMDEFVAHWKQYLVYQRPPTDNAARAVRINNFLLRDPHGYRNQIGVLTGPELTDPAQTGWIWDKTPNNVKTK